jgi:O-antigen ligase
VGLGLVLVNLWRYSYRQILNNLVNWGLVIWGLGTIAVSLFAVHQQESWLGLANFLPFLALFVALSNLLASVDRLRQLAWFLVLPSLAVIAIGWGQMLVNWESPPWLAGILGWELIAQGVPPGRMSSVFIYANFLAVYLAIALTLGLGLWLENWQLWREKAHKKQLWRLVALSIILLADISGLVSTSSRNAWGIAFLSCMLFAIYSGWRWLVWAITGITTTILWASFAPKLGGEWLRNIVPAFFWARLSDNMYPDRPIATLRLTQWRFCWDLIKERPITGWGLRNFTPIYEAKMNVWFGHPHNLFLMLAAEIGVLLTLLLSAIIAWILAEGILLLKNWSLIKSKQQDSLIYFSYLLAFINFICFNLFDVTIFDLRINLLGWIILSGINGLTMVDRQLIKISRGNL